MVPKGKNIGLNPKERKEWTRKVVLEVLADHSIDLAPTDETIIWEPATPENLSKAVQGIGLLNIVAYVYNNVFHNADQIEEEAFNKFHEHSTIPYPGHKTVHKVMKLAKSGAWLEAIDAAIGEPRRRKVAHHVYPFLQEAAQNQPNLGAFVRRFLSCSPPDKLSQAIRMRKYALDQHALGTFIQDNPKDLADFYWNSILQDLQVESLPENFHQLAMAMIKAGTSKEDITKAIKQVNFGELQTIPPSTKSLNGFTFQIVPKTDNMVIQASRINDSCMHLGGVAHDCVIDILSNPRAALLIIKKKLDHVPSADPELFLKLQETDELRNFFAERLRTGKMKMSVSLEAQGYVGYSYIRHGLSNTLYLDNVELVEQNEEGKRKVLGIALHNWILSIMQDLGSKRALIGKAYSQGILDDHSLPECQLSRDQLFQDMPKDVQTYADLCKEHGAWEITP